MVRRTERLVLRCPVAGDAASLFAIYGDPGTNVFNPFGPYPDIERARAILVEWVAHWRQHGFGWWAIATAANPSVVIGYGGVGYRKYLGSEVLDLGYRFSVDSWGNGYATELGRAAIGVAFGDLAKTEVFAIVRPGNQPSIHVLDKMGMTFFDTLDDVPGEALSLMYRAVAD